MKKGLLLVVASLLFSVGHIDVQAKTYIRYEAHSAGGQKALASMQKAIEILKKAGCKDPISWYYQGAMHWTPDVSQSYLNQNPLCPSYNTANPQLAVAWNNCASHNSTGPNSGIHFLPWHRMYLIYFEKIIREVSKDPDFALPYWNYGVPNNTSPLLIMPQPFQKSTGGSLYEESRRISLNEGKPIDDKAQHTIQLDLNELNVPDYATFNSQLNGGLHGFMHNYIGGFDGTFNPIYNTVVTDAVDQGCGKGCGMMTEVPSAGFDPIFWLHHANVDRLWQNFIDNSANQNITLAQLQSVTWPYTFFEIVADGKSKEVQLSMNDVMAAISSVDYVYDDAKPTPTLKETAKNADLKENVLLSIQPEHSQASLNKPASLQLSLPAQVSVSNDKSETVSHARTLLELDVSYQNNHRGRYEVFINLPKNIAVDSKEANQYYAGAISFFVHDPEEKGGSNTFRYDITDELASANISNNEVTISVVKTDGPEAGVITINNARLISLK